MHLLVILPVCTPTRSGRPAGSQLLTLSSTGQSDVPAWYVARAARPAYGLIPACGSTPARKQPAAGAVRQGGAA